jgi:hypothetical protein
MKHTTGIMGASVYVLGTQCLLAARVLFEVCRRRERLLENATVREAVYDGVELELSCVITKFRDDIDL